MWEFLVNINISLIFARLLQFRWLVDFNYTVLVPFACAKRCVASQVPYQDFGSWFFLSPRHISRAAQLLYVQG